MQNNGNRFYLYIIYDGHYFCTSFRFDKIKIFLQEYKKHFLTGQAFLFRMILKIGFGRVIPNYIRNNIFVTHL